MASYTDIQTTYDVLHPAWIKFVPPPADLTCARYETGAETLTEAQNKKLA
jgi:cyclopropane fatty-acyl-phospholipid synthase-like methyltransferase